VSFRAGADMHGYALEDVMDAYVDWREQSRNVWDAYQRWVRAAPQDERLRFAAYLAELDQEQRASAVYAATIDRTLARL
jgi:NAD-dependent SIR2 family protein deacetylase